MDQFNAQERRKALDIIKENHEILKNNGSEPFTMDVRIESERFYAVPENGREIGIPYSWLWRLERATQDERKNWRFIGKGAGIHWKKLIKTFLQRVSSPVSQRTQPDRQRKPL